MNSTMKNNLLYAIFLLNISICLSQDGESMYKRDCFMCHNHVDAEEPLTAPVLGGITKEVKLDWLIAYTNNSMEMLNKGDFRARCLWEYYQPCVMPSYADSLTNEQIIDIYVYIDKITEEKNLKYSLDCDSSMVLSPYYYDSLEVALSKKLDIDLLKGFSNFDFNGRRNLKVSISGDFKNVRFYLIYENRNQCMPIYYTRESSNIFYLDNIGIESGLIYLVIISQGDYDKFEIARFKLNSIHDEFITLKTNPNRSINSVVNDFVLH